MRAIRPPRRYAAILPLSSAGPARSATSSRCGKTARAIDPARRRRSYSGRTDIREPSHGQQAAPHRHLGPRPGGHREILREGLRHDARRQCPARRLHDRRDHECGAVEFRRRADRGLRGPEECVRPDPLRHVGRRSRRDRQDDHGGGRELSDRSQGDQPERLLRGQVQDPRGHRVRRHRERMEGRRQGRDAGQGGLRPRAIGRRPREVRARAAQAAWPERPVVLVVPFAAGGITDLLARITAERLQTAFRQTFIVENQLGAAGVVAADRVARAAPDGYTLLFTPVFQVTMAPFTHIIKFDPVKDFAPVAIVASSPFVITVGASVPARTLGEFIAYVKVRPGQVPFASAGAGSLTHVSSAAFIHSAGLDMIHVPYKGLAPAFTDLLGGQIAMLSATPVELKPYLESGKVKPLAVTGRERSPQLPAVPTIAETLPSPPVVTYNGLLAPARTPGDIIDALSRELMAAERSPEFLERLSRLGAEPLVNTPAEFARIIAADTELWRDLVRELGIKAE